MNRTSVGTYLLGALLAVAGGETWSRDTGIVGGIVGWVAFLIGLRLVAASRTQENDR